MQRRMGVVAAFNGSAGVLPVSRVGIDKVMTVEKVEEERSREEEQVEVIERYQRRGVVRFPEEGCWVNENDETSS